MDIRELLGRISTYILNPLIVLLFAVALIVFFWGVFQFISKASEGEERETGKKKILWGLIGMFVMVSAYGLINLVLGTFGIPDPQYLDEKL